ncbi:MAG TPA: hypothetical protein VFF13_05165 [archaeon]|nr:hypothetical protein [archaeon]
MPEKMFVGLDGSDGIGFDPEISSHFVLVAVSCSDKEEAKKAAHSIDAHGPKRQLYTKWKLAIDDLLHYDLRYYVLLFDKTSTSDSFKKNFRNLPTSQWNTSRKKNAIFEKYAKQGWLIPETWFRFKGKFPSEFKFDGDLNGAVWELCMKQIKTHAENHVGLCDVGVAGEENHLIKIAHVIATFAHNQLIDGSTINGEPEVVLALKPKVLVFTLITDPEVGMFGKIPTGFTPW